VKILQNIFLKFDDCSQSKRDNIVTQYAFFKKHFAFWQIFTPKKMMLEALRIHIANFSKCLIVLYKHLCTLKVKRQISHAYMWRSLVSQFFYFFYVLWILISWSMFSFLSFFDLKNLAKLVVLCTQICNWFGNKKSICNLNLLQHESYSIFIVLAYQGKDIVFRFIMEYTSLRDFGPCVIIGLFLYEDL